MKLYRNSADLERWTAYLPETGWVSFPAVERGWERRLPAGPLDPHHLHEVPLWLAFNTGMLESRSESEAREAA